MIALPGYYDPNTITYAAAATATSITVVITTAVSVNYYPEDDFDYELAQFRRELEEAKRRRPPLPPPPPIDGYKPRPALPIRPAPRIMRVQSRGG